MSGRVGRLAASALLVAATSCTSAAAMYASPVAATTVDDDRSGLGDRRFHYTGRWEHVRGARDGRDFGTSARSPYLGNSFALAFTARRYRIYGVTGPKGGRGILALDRNPDVTTLEFFSPTVRTHVLLYSSPPLAPGLHSISVMVDGTRAARSRGTYVNLDSVELEP